MSADRNLPADDGRQLRNGREIVTALAVLAAGAVLPVTQSAGAVDGALHETIEAVGVALIALCLAGRAWCALYLSAPKDGELVIVGPYSLCRHPAMLFLAVGVAGLAAQTGSATVALAAGVVTFVIFRPFVLMEEAVMYLRHGEDYARYCRQVPRFLPRFSGWRDRPVLAIRPAVLYRTLRDGVVFVGAIPLFEVIDFLQLAGRLPVLFRFY